MKKTNLRVDVWPNHFTVKVESKWREWLFHQLFTVKVMDNSRQKPVDVTERVSLPPRPGRVVTIKRDPEAIPTKPKSGGRVVMILPPGVKRMKRSQERGQRTNP